MMIRYIDSLIVCAVLVATVLYKSDLVQHEEKYDCLSLENTVNLRGILSVLIVLQHLSGYYTAPGFMAIFKHIGFIVVGVFFFLSGYGLMSSRLHKADYMINFLKRRIVKLIVPFWVANLLYATIFWVIGYEFTVEKLMLSMLGIGIFTENGMINGPSWYISVQVILYILFFLAYRKNIRHVCFMFLFVLLTMALVLYGDELYWRSILAFPVGMLWAIYKQEIANIRQQAPAAIWIGSVSVTFLSTFISVFGVVTDNGVLLGFGQLLFSASACVLLFLVLQFIKIGNCITHFLGHWSSEIYLMHKLALICSWKILSVSQINQLVFMFVVMTGVCIGVFSFLLKRICEIKVRR